MAAVCLLVEFEQGLARFQGIDNFVGSSSPTSRFQRLLDGESKEFPTILLKTRCPFDRFLFQVDEPPYLQGPLKFVKPMLIFSDPYESRPVVPLESAITMQVVQGLQVVLTLDRAYYPARGKTVNLREHRRSGISVLLRYRTSRAQHPPSSSSSK